MIGDYAFAIWDAESEQLFCARDAIGIKPFYYFFCDGVFIFGSELDQVATYSKARSTLDYPHIFNFSQDRTDSREATFFSKIRRLKPAHCMQVSSTGIRQSRYWDPVNMPLLELNSLEEYVNNFAALLTEAIRVRMPGPAEKLGVLLSGGVDSTSVVAGIRQLAGDASNGDQLLALSLGFADLPCDESATIRDNAKRLGLNVYLHQHKPLKGADVREAIAQTFAPPESVTARAYGELFNYARKNHIRVVMGGWGADDWLGAWQGVYRDLLATRQFRALSRVVQRDVSNAGLRATLAALLKECTRDPIARQLKRWVLAGRLPLFAERANYIKDFDKAGWKSVSQWNQYRWLNSSMFASNCEMQELSAARRGIETRYPFNDRRIVEFGLRLPPGIFAKSARNKPSIRMLVARWVPEIRSSAYTDPEGSSIYWQSLRQLYSDGEFDLSRLGRHFRQSSRWSRDLAEPLDNPLYDAKLTPDIVRKQWNSYTCGLWLDYFSHRNRYDTSYAQRNPYPTETDRRPEA